MDSILRCKIRDIKPIEMKEQEITVKMKEYLFYSSQYPLRNILITGMMNAGKSRLWINIMKSQSHKQKTIIYLFSAVSRLDPKIEQLKKEGYMIQTFDQEQVNQGILEQLYNELEKEADFQIKENKKKWFTIKYVKKWIIFDDIDIPPKQIIAFKSLLRYYRHTQAPVVFLQQDFVAFIKKGIRNLFNVQIFFQSIPLDRLFENVHKQLRDNITKEEFLSIYKDATKNDHEFLLIDSFGNPVIYQKMFDYIYLVGDSKKAYEDGI